MKKKLAFCILILFVFAVFGCGVSNTKVTRENYDKISVGMTLEQVTSIVGKADSVSESEAPGIGKMEMLHFQLGNKAIDVFLLDGKVDSKNWTEI